MHNQTRPLQTSSLTLITLVLVFAVWLQQPMLFAANEPAATEPTKNNDEKEPAEMMPDDCGFVDNERSKIVCTCTELKCSEFTFEWPTVSGQANLVATARSGLRFKVSQLSSAIDAAANNVSSSSSSKVVVNLSAHYQRVLGWGGAFTDAAAINIQSLSEPLRQRLIDSYFGPGGLGYNFGRVPIGGSDFSTRAYSYDDSQQVDLNLTNWSLAEEDLNYKIPVIKRAIEAAGKDTNGTSRLKLFASPWSPPKWMKTSNDFKRGHLIDSDEIYASYANYLVKFYQSYREHGIDFWGATVQNEPLAAYLPFYFFNSLQMSASETIRLVVDHLGPALEANGYTKDNFKLMIGDDSLGFVNYQVPAIMNDERVQKYISGLAFHWYLSGFIAPYDSLSKLVDKIRDKIEFVMMSESCQGAFMSFKHVALGDWSRGESYASDIIEDFRRSTGAWIDWNLALDLEGGPNWARNYVDSPVIVDKEKNEFIKQPMYYVLAHFTRFMKPNSIVVGSSAKRIGGVSVLAAHIEETNHLIINILNKSNSKRQFPVEINQPDRLMYSLNKVEVEPKSISTIILKL